MNIEFDFENITTTEFGLGLDQDDSRTYVQIPVDMTVQTALKEMVQETIKQFAKNSQEPETYSPSEKYASNEYVTLPINDDMAVNIKALHDAASLTENASALQSMDDCFAYFYRLHDNNGKKLTAVRRSSQFKGILKKKNRMIRWLDDTLKAIPDDIFKLDSDFDFIVDDSLIHILRPSGLEFTAQLQGEITAAVKTNIQTISTQITFIDFTNISEYAEEHTRAARYLASIKSQQEAVNINKDKLKQFCETANISFSEDNGKIFVEEKDVLGFLEVMDRRRFWIDITDEDDPELYRAPSRSKIKDS